MCYAFYEAMNWWEKVNNSTLLLDIVYIHVLVFLTYIIFHRLNVQ